MKKRKTMWAGLVAITLIFSGFAASASAATMNDGLVTLELKTGNTATKGSVEFNVYEDTNNDKVFDSNDSLITTINVVDGVGNYDAVAGTYFFQQKTAISGYEKDTTAHMVTVNEKKTVNTWEAPVVDKVVSENTPFPNITGYEDFKSVFSTKNIYMDVLEWNGMSDTERKQAILDKGEVSAQLVQGGSVLEELKSLSMINEDLSTFAVGENKVNLQVYYLSPLGNVNTSVRYARPYLSESDFAKGLSSQDLINLTGITGDVNVNGTDYPIEALEANLSTTSTPGMLGTIAVKEYEVFFTFNSGASFSTSLYTVADSVDMNDVKAAISGSSVGPATQTLENGDTVNVVKSTSHGGGSSNIDYIPLKQEITVNLVDLTLYNEVQTDDHTLVVNNNPVVPPITPTNPPSVVEKELPKTGDSTGTIGLSVLMLGSATLLVALLRKRKLQN